MENKQVERCCPGNFMNEEYHKITYCCNKGSLGMTLTKRSLIWWSKEPAPFLNKMKAFVSTMSKATILAMKKLCWFDPYQLHKKHISKKRHIPKSIPAEELKTN